MSVKERVKEFTIYSNISIKAFEDSINVSNGYVNSISKSIGIDKISLILENYPNLSLEWLLAGKGTMLKSSDIVSEPQTNVYKLQTDRLYEEQSVPLYNIEAAAGIVTLFRDTAEYKPVDHIHIPNLPKCDGAVYINGDSMYPLLKSGDIVMYRQHNIQDGIIWGEMYLISYEQSGDDITTVKYIKKSDEGKEYIKLVSQNSHHQDRDIPLKKVRALALVKASIRINSMS